MTREELREVVLAQLARIAPEIDPAVLDTATPLREQVDLDSVDFMNFLVAVDRELGVVVPEMHYARMSTLDDCVDYLARHGASRRARTEVPARSETRAG